MIPQDTKKRSNATAIAVVDAGSDDRAVEQDVIVEREKLAGPFFSPVKLPGDVALA